MISLNDPPTSRQRIPVVNSKQSSAENTFTPIKIVASLIIVITIVVFTFSLYYVDQATEEDRIRFQNLEERIANGDSLTNDEKLLFDDLLFKIRGFRLFTCKFNYITKIGSLTGYEVSEHDIDWRGTGKKLDEALKEAFRLTGVPIENFRITQWSTDEHGKTFPVEWVGDQAEVNIDAPHIKKGPDVYHVGFKSGKKTSKIVGHIFLDYIPYGRGTK
ncbi:MAG: hypothetical protein IPL26_16820 [Leptospiraceae bacterium]|nr:hypothetical protein [Leptospiraceae bacterium]